MTTRGDFRRVQRVIQRNREIDPTDVDVARQYLSNWTVYAWQRVVFQTVLAAACIAVGIGLAISDGLRIGDLILPAIGVTFAGPTLLRYHRIRRWCDRHPEIAYRSPGDQTDLTKGEPQ